MELITKDNLRLSGIYGKKILNSINARLIKEDKETLHYSRNKTHLFYYKTNKKIYITGNNSEELYNNIIKNIEFYLLRLVEIDNESLRLRLGIDLYNEFSLYSEYHIFNMEVLRGIALKYPERLSYAELFATNITYLSLLFYEELMHFILYCEDNDLVHKVCEKLKKTVWANIDEEWNKLSSEIDLDNQVIIYENLRKIKI